MIKDKLIPLLEQKFGASSFVTGEVPDPIVIFPASHPDVGELKVLDDKTEAIITIGTITHGHFYSFEEGATRDQAELEVAESVADFIEDLFNGKYILWRSKGGGAGGWHLIDYTPADDKLSYLEKDADFFIWSGPCKTD